MPGPWIYFKENGDFFADFKVEKGEYYECHQYDPEKSPQGFTLWQVKSLVETNKDGIWVNARLVAVSDSHLHWWVTKGPGKDEKRKFNLHLCAKDFAQCRRGRGRGPMEFHSDHFRVLSAHDISDLRVSWFKDREAKEDMKLEVERLMGKEKEAPLRGSRKRPLAESTSEREEGDLPAAVEHPEGSGAVTEGLKKLRSEVDKDKKNEDDKKDAPRRRRERLRHEERDLDTKKEKEKGKMAKKPDNKPRGKGNWFGEKGEPQHSTSDSMDTKSDDTPRRAKKKRKKRRKAKQADRGPFGVGRRVKFGEGSTEGSRESNSEDSDQVFQAAPSDKSRQLQLMEYSQQYPGRLAARLLTKMQELLAREEGALNPVGRNQTPAAATSYFLTVVTPNYKDRMNVRAARELRTIAKALDLVATGRHPEAADVLAQRYKALELQMADQTWARAQHLELLPPEGASLIDKDESLMATKEQSLDMKMKGAIFRNWSPKGKEEKGKDGKNAKGKSKGKKGQSNWNPSWNAGGDQEQAPPA